MQLIEITSKLETELNIELYPTLFFEYQNIKALSEYFCTEHLEKFTDFSQCPETLFLFSWRTL
ncbi:acyl carrier protein [Candidatus Margulisiibacteriota bacterium]